MIRRTSLMVPIFVLAVAACAEADVPAGDTSETTTAATATTTAEPTAPTVSTTGEPSGLQALRKALADFSDVTSGRMEGSIEMTGSTPENGVIEIATPFSGAFDNESGDHSLLMDVSEMAAAAGADALADGAALIGEEEMRQIGVTAYVRTPFFATIVGAETPWISMPAGGLVPIGGFAALSVANPVDLLDAFGEADATVEVVGVETVNGVATTHYVAVFDPMTVMNQATPEERGRLGVPDQDIPEAISLEIWVADDGPVARFVVESRAASPYDEPGESWFGLSMRYDLFDLNGEIVIDPPPADEVTDIADLDLAHGFDPSAGFGE